VSDFAGRLHERVPIDPAFRHERVRVDRLQGGIRFVVSRKEEDRREGRCFSTYASQAAGARVPRASRTASASFEDSEPSERASSSFLRYA
jgi:hypothetical protein